MTKAMISVAILAGLLGGCASSGSVGVHYNLHTAESEMIDRDSVSYIVRRSWR